MSYLPKTHLNVKLTESNDTNFIRKQTSFILIIINNRLIFV